MKRPPVLIIINLILLTAGYLYSSYSLAEKMIYGTHSGMALVMLIMLMFMTLVMIGIYFAVLKRHIRSILLMGAILLLTGFFSTFRINYLFLTAGTLFIIWSCILSMEDIDLIKENSIIGSKKYRYWLYSASIFCISGILIGIWGMGSWSISLKDNMLLIMLGFLVAGLLMFIIYFVLCKIRERRENKINNPEKN